MRKLAYILLLIGALTTAQSKDDFKHFSAGMAISATTNQLSESLFDGKHKVISFAIPLTVAVSWEIWRKNGFDWKDVGWTMGGAVTGYVLHEWLKVPNQYIIIVGVGSLGILVSF